MPLFEEAGIERLKKFIEEVKQIEFSYDETPNYDLVGMKIAMQSLAENIIVNNDLDYWYVHTNLDKINELFRLIDKNTGTYTPCIYEDEQSIKLFICYASLLLDIYRNWNDYLSSMTRFSLLEFNLYQQLENALYYMKMERDMRDRRVRSQKPLKTFSAILKEIQELTSKTNPDELHDKANELSTALSKIYDKIMELPPVFEGSAQTNSQQCQSQAKLLAELMQCEISFNKHLLSQNHEPTFLHEGARVEQQLEYKILNEFKQSLQKNLDQLKTQLLDYMSNGEENKKIIATKLFTEILNLENILKEDTTGKCFAARYFLQNAKSEHLKLLLQSSMDPGRFGEILDNALKELEKLESSITMKTDSLLANKLNESFAVVNGVLVTKSNLSS